MRQAETATHEEEMETLLQRTSKEKDDLIQGAAEEKAARCTAERSFKELQDNTARHSAAPDTFGAQATLSLYNKITTLDCKVSVADPRIPTPSFVTTRHGTYGFLGIKPLQKEDPSKFHFDWVSLRKEVKSQLLDLKSDLMELDATYDEAGLSDWIRRLKDNYTASGASHPV
jgi:hypothetical protein